MAPRTLRRATERGQAITEYALIMSVWVAVLFLPWAGGRAPALLLIDSFQIYLSSFHTVIMLPIP